METPSSQDVKALIAGKVRSSRRSVPLSEKQNIQIPTQVETLSQPDDAAINERGIDSNEATLTKEDDLDKVVTMQSVQQTGEGQIQHSEHSVTDLNDDE